MLSLTICLCLADAGLFPLIALPSPRAVASERSMDLSSRQGRREQGQRLQKAVERAGLSVEELAGRIGCSRALIYQYVSGSTLAQPDRLQQIAALCSVPLSYFYVDEPEAVDATEAQGSENQADRDVAARLFDSLRNLEELAAAQESPPDHRALVSTCERIVSLSAQIGARIDQARAQMRLGSALLTIGDNPRAADALSRAIVLAADAADDVTVVSARQSLGRVLLAMGRTADAREQFELTAQGAPSARWRGLLALGAVHELHGEYKEAMQRFDEAAAVLEESEGAERLPADEVRLGMLYVNANRVNVYLDGGDFAEARPLAEKCLADAEATGNADQHLEARLNLACCDFYMGAWTQAYRGLTTLLQLARFVGDSDRETKGRAWLGILMAAAGDSDSALAAGKDALAAALSRGDRMGEFYAQIALSDAYANVRVRESFYHANQALGVTLSLQLERAETECRLRLARLEAAEQRWREASRSAESALALAQRLGARHLESLALSRSASIRADDGQARSAQPGALIFAAERALELAESTRCLEACWRAHVAISDACQQGQSPDAARAEEHLRRAIELLQGLRAELLQAGLPDTLLESPDCLYPYERLTELLQSAGNQQALDEILDLAGWPPLTDRLASSAEQG